MPFNSSNVFQRLYSWVTDRDNSVLILAERMDSDTDDIVAGINRIMSGEADFVGPLKGVNGTANAPAWSFTDDPDSGFYRAAANTVGVSTGGVKKVEIAGLETKFFNNLVVNAGTITNIQLNNSTTSQSSFPTPDASVGAPPKIEGEYKDGYVGVVLHPKQTVNYDLAITMKEGDEGGPQWWADAVEYKIWTENNDGAGSGLDADTLDGFHASEFAPNTPQREVLEANRTYYVRTDGVDTNDGLSNDSGGAFVTIQKAVDEALKLDANSFGVEIQVAAGSYFERVTMLSSVIGADRLLIQGDTSTPSNVIVGKDGFDSFRFTAGAKVEIRGFKCEQAGSWGNGVYLSGGSDVKLGAMDFGNMPRFHIEAELGAAVQVTTDYTISGGASRHINVATNSIVTSENRTITVVGTPSFNQFILATSGATVSMWNPSFNGAATGQRFSVSLNGVLNTSGKAIDFLPGDVAGVTTTGGQYG